MICDISYVIDHVCPVYFFTYRIPDRLMIEMNTYISVSRREVAADKNAPCNLLMELEVPMLQLSEVVCWDAAGRSSEGFEFFGLNSACRLDPNVEISGCLLAP